MEKKIFQLDKKEICITSTQIKRAIDLLINENEILQDRIDKAIEYIEKYADENFTCVEDTEVWDKEIKNLYEILKGE